MKHFIIIIHYKVTSEKINEIRPRHRQFLEKAYEQEVALFSGPQVSGKGGIVAARGKTIEEVEKFFGDDPYIKEKAAKYQFIEFQPGHYQKCLENWINNE